MNELDKYPIDTVEQVKEAGEHFEEHLSKFSPSTRVKIAAKMYTACIRFKQPIIKEASYNNYLNHVLDDGAIIKEAELKEAVRCRRDMLNAEKPIGSEKVANDQLDTLLSFSGKMTIKKASDLFNTFDTEQGFHKEWDTKLADPWLSSSNAGISGVNSFDKLAKEYDVVDIHNMSCYPDMVKSANSVLEDSICDDFLENPFLFIKKTASEIQTIFFDKMREYNNA